MGIIETKKVYHLVTVRGFPLDKVKKGIDVAIKKTQPVTVAFITAKGSFSMINEAFGDLFAFVVENGFLPAGPPSGIYFDAPGRVPEKELRWELRVPIAGICDASGPNEKGLGFRCLEETVVASAIHRGPFSNIGNTYEKLTQWIDKNGYKITGPCEEVYLNEPGNTPPAELMTEVRFPVSNK